MFLCMRLPQVNVQHAEVACVFAMKGRSGHRWTTCTIRSDTFASRSIMTKPISQHFMQNLEYQHLRWHLLWQSVVPLDSRGSEYWQSFQSNCIQLWKLPIEMWALIHPLVQFTIVTIQYTVPRQKTCSVLFSQEPEYFDTNTHGSH